MKLSQKNWKSLVSGILLAASASSFLIAPVYAADYDKGLFGTVAKDSEMLSQDGNTVQEIDGVVTYDFQGKDHTFTVKNKDGITARKDTVYNNISADGSYGTLHVYQTNNKSNAWANVNGITANKGNIIVNSNLDITAASEYSSVGIAAANKGNLIINGNVKMRKDDAENPWGIITKNVHGNVGPGGSTSMGGDANYTGARWQPAGISVDYSRGDITINGDVDIAVRGTAVRTDVYQGYEGVAPYDLGTISLVGNSTKIITPYREKNFVEGFGEFIEPYYALASYGGTINVNVKNLEAQNGKVEMVGNVLAMKASDEAGKAMVYQNGRLNIGLTTQDSSWKGVIDNAGTAKAGEVNLWVQNGAQWIYENASRKDGLDAANLADYSRPYYEKYDGISHLSSLVGGKDKASAGIIKVNDNDPIHIANAEGVTKVWYDHADTTPGTIIGGDVKVLNAKEGTEMMLYTGNNGITKGFDAADTAAEKNNVSEVLNSLAHKLWYMAGDSNLKGSVSIAEGLTASSATMKTGNITFAEGGQGFYDYTPEEDKTDYKTGAIAESENISKTRKLDINGVAHVDVTEPTTNSGYAKLASALYAGEATYSSDPMIVDMGGKGLALSATTGTGQAAAIYANDNAYINVVNPSAEQKLTITSNNTSTTGAHGIYAKGNAHLNISGPVEITDVTTKGDAGNGISIQGEKSEIKIDGSLKISNVKGIRERGKGINASGILVTGDTSSVTVTGPVDISGVRGSGIKLAGKDTKVSVGGGNITAAEDSDKSHNFYAVRVEKGTLDINMKDGAAGDTTTKITGDMYATGQYGKKVVEYTGGELINWADAGILNVALTNDKSFWKGVAAYDQYNSDYGSGGNTMHDIGQINLYLQNGAAWTNEQQSHVTTTTVSKAEWGGSTLASLHGGSNAANAGLIYQKDNNPISVVNYSGHTTVFYEHDAADPTNIIGGDFNITNAAKGSAITFVTDNTGITSGFEDGDSAEAKDNVANVLNSMAGKLFYKNYADGNLAGVVKIADGLTASSAALKTGDISFSTETTGTKKPGQGYYDYKPSGEKPEYNTGAISKSEDISKTRELNADGIAEVKVTEPTITEGYSKFAAALYAEEASVPMNVKMAGKGLALSSVVEKGAQAAGIFVANGANITVANPTADQKLTITAANNDTYGAYGIFVKGSAAKLNVSGPVEITDVTTKGAAVSGVVVRGQNSDVVIDGPLKISNVKAEADSAGGINGAGISVTGVGSTVTVNGPVDISGIYGSGIRLTEVGNKVSVGGGNIAAAADTDKSHNYYAVRVERGTLDINMKDGVAGDTTTTISGDMYINCLHGMKPPSLGSEEVVEFKDAGILNVALTNDKSSWTGVAAHEKYKTDKHQYGYDMHDVGEFNLYLQNGATWTNEQQSHVTSTTMADKNPVWDGSTLASLRGGSDAAHAGNIFQKDSKNITIENYSGNTNIFYAHEGNGEAAENYKAGDIVIKSAAKNSAVSLITDNTDIFMDNAENVAKVLNALAGKLTYSNYAKGERNLDGKVKIAGGLTSDSVTMAVGDILFNEADGKGSGAEHITVPSAPETQVSTSFNTTLTGDTDKDLEYVLGGAVKDGSYKFTEATSINVSGEGAKGMNLVKGTTVDASGKTLTVNVTDASKGNAGISQDVDVNSTIKADKLVIKLDSKKSGKGAQAIRQDKGNLTIDANVDIDVKGDNSTMGIYSHAGSTTVNGDVKVVLDGKRGGFNEYGAAGIYAHAGYGGAVGGTVNVNGNVDISGVGNGLFANIGGATINVNGGKINIVDTDKKNGYSAIYATCGSINMNTVKDEKGKVIGAGNNKVDITGNVVVSVGAVNYVDCCTETEVNVGLTTKDSKLTGVVYNQFPEGGKTVSQKGDSKTFTGAANLWLQNGALWTNEQQGELPSVWGGEKFNGSRVNKLAGGANAAAAGTIYQKDSKNLTIDNYSGVTNIIYAHNGDGTGYAAGDTVIKHAEAGSVVNMITSNQGVTDIGAALNALAGKLTYLNYATANGSERNLNGYVKLAGGLTSDSVTMVTGDIRFSEETGKGSGTDNIKFADEPDNQIAKTFNSTLTGEKLKDLEYVMGGVVKDGTYKFTENTAINVSGEGAKAMDFAKGTTVDASGKTLTVNVTDASKGNAGISQDVDVNSTIKADKLVIKLDSKKSGKGAQAIRQDKGNLTIDANVDIDVKGDNSTMGIYSHAGSTTVNGDVKVVLDGNRGGFNEYGAAGIYAHAGYGGAVGGTVNVNGNVDISGVGNGLFANIGGATINVNGGKINIVDTDKKNGYSAIYATCGAINMNTVKDAAG
ncbi:beta strand repeat-containing protein, partial [Phascolarctobacterium succinatutens]|uniref:beta strand repeat-containing protein n=1 Tax=Phascolarctobacterium succinatutens TaxID=626940 RepID=UPI0026EDD837